MYYKIYVYLSAIALVAAVPKKMGRIIGGTDIAIEKTPYQVSLQLDNNHMCGGTIYSKDVIVTAAHCIISMNIKMLSVRVGSDSHNCGGSVSKVAAVYMHEEFALSHMLNDLAILLLATPIKLCDLIKPIPLADAAPVPGSKVLVTGWGKTDSNAMRIPQKLQAVKVKIIDNKKCKEAYPSEVIAEESLCAAAPGKDACQGDSGGPLVYKHQLVGVVSWGYDCGSPHHPGVYTNIAVLHNWIVRAVSVLRKRLTRTMFK